MEIKLSEILQKLSKPLQPHEVGIIADWKSIFKTKQGKYKALFLIHKTSRSVYNRFNEVCGLGWFDDYKRDDKGELVCSISVWDAEKERWIIRKGVGSESSKDKIKGEYSDALKRASTAFGFGTELYTMPKIIIDLEPDDVSDEGSSKVSLSPYFSTKMWRVDYALEGEIVKNLKITDEKCKVRWRM